MIPSSSIREYRLPDLLTTDSALVLDTVNALLTLLLADEIALQQRLSRREMCVLIALLEAHPAVCSSSDLYAAVTEIGREDAQAFIEALRQE